jgi:hypothetical protein
MTNFTSDIDRAAAGYSPDRVDALARAFNELLVEPMNCEGIYELYRQDAEAAAQRRSHDLLKPCPSLARWSGSRRRRRRAEQLRWYRLRAPPIPRNAWNAAEIHGFCAAVLEVRIHLPPAESLQNFGPSRVVGTAA